MQQPQSVTRGLRNRLELSSGSRHLEGEPGSEGPILTPNNWYENKPTSAYECWKELKEQKRGAFALSLLAFKPQKALKWLNICASQGYNLVPLQHIFKVKQNSEIVQFNTCKIFTSNKMNRSFQCQMCPFLVMCTSTNPFWRFTQCPTSDKKHISGWNDREMILPSENMTHSSLKILLQKLCKILTG